MEPRQPAVKPHWVQNEFYFEAPETIAWAVKAQNYIEQHPAVWTLFCELAKYAVKKSPSGKASSKLIFEKIRWENEVEKSNEDFKINNNYTAYFARKFMAEHWLHPRYSIAFNTKETKQ
ncbi:MAG: hypothetical protein AAF542_18020 [Pseudomonadota bacterium]